jgi:LacI family transcriptional regulator
MGGYLATRHLIQLGHRRIAHIQGPLRHRVSHDRLRGYRDALEEAGISFDPALVAEGDFMPPGGRACAKQFFALAERPTAIFAGNDLMAYGAMGAAEEQGLRIPDDLALVGFDDIPSSAHMQPALTTIRQPFYEMGLCAFELLLSLVEAPPERAGFAFNAPLTFNHLDIDGHRPEIPVVEEMHHPTRIRLATNLVVRASCGASRQLSLSE